jgi:hypothetical protein
VLLFLVVAVMVLLLVQGVQAVQVVDLLTALLMSFPVSYCQQLLLVLRQELHHSAHY